MGVPQNQVSTLRWSNDLDDLVSRILGTPLENPGDLVGIVQRIVAISSGKLCLQLEKLSRLNQ